MPRPFVSLLAVVAVLSSGVAVAAAAPAPYRPTVVVAVADTGINPYHRAFYRPRLTRNPCTYVAGFRCDAVRELPLSVGRYKTYAEAVAADKDVWARVEPHVWYWIPRTNIVGAVCDTATSASTELDPFTCILDDNGHGTGTASSVVSEAPDALLLVHDGNSAATDFANMPVVPDVQTHSWGPAAPLPLQALDLAMPGSSDGCGPVRRKESVFFIAAGNEAPWPAVLDCDRKALDVNIVGGSYPGYWSPQSWQTADFVSWMCRPVAVHTEITKTATSCGTSFASPTAAGAAAAALLTLRRQDGYTGRSTTRSVSRTVSRDAFVAALRAGASYTPEKKFPFNENCVPGGPCQAGPAATPGLPLPPQAPWVFYGYGWLDSTVAPAVVACARHRACPAKPAGAQQWHDLRTRLRTAFDEGPVRPGPQQDGGTSRDAGESREAAVPIVPGRPYRGTVEPYGLGGDRADWYSFPVRAGQRISVTGSASLHDAVPVDVAPYVGCWYLLRPDGTSMDPDRAPFALYDVNCTSTGTNAPPVDVRAPVTGTYVLVYTAHQGLPKHDYRFTVAVA